MADTSNPTGPPSQQMTSELRHRSSNPPSQPQPQPQSQPQQSQQQQQQQRQQQQQQQQQASLRARVVAGAMGLGLVTCAVGGTYLLSENDTVFPFAVAACVATFSSVLLRFALAGFTADAATRTRVRHFRSHRHFTGERAAYVRTSQRLAMMDRDFTAADYEMLLDLDNNSQRLRRFLEGASQETVARLPTYIYQSKKPNKPSAEQTAEQEEKSGIAGDEDEDDVAEDEVSKEKKQNAEKSRQPDLSQTAEIAGATANSCTICLEDFEDGMKIRVLPCFHRFMAECIDPWLEQQAKCPVCKFRIV